MSDDAHSKRPDPALDARFKHELVAITPHLRAYARSLCGAPEHADDLVQETLLKAWQARASFDFAQPLKNWAFVILRNSYRGELRRRKFVGDYDEDAAARILVVAPAQANAIELADVQRALKQLPLAQREALILVGAGDMSYEEAADICGCAIGTMKSRVSRARAALAEILDSGRLDEKRRDAPPPGAAFGDIMGSIPDVIRNQRKTG